MTPLVSAATDSFGGEVRVPGDKSISHRALMIGAAALGETTVAGLLEGEDVLCTAACLRALGADIDRDADGTWRVCGRGVGGFRQPDDILDMGNSGTGARLLAGLLATHPFLSFMTGDASLRKRPMARVTEPLSRMGAGFLGRAGGRLPMSIQGCAEPIPIDYRLPVASAQVKSAVLLAALNTPGRTTVIEPSPTRDHTERLLRHFGAEIETGETQDGAGSIAITGQPELTGTSISVPADPSSAAFPAVAALLVPGSCVTLRDVGINPRRMGLYETLAEMGADLIIDETDSTGGEPVADITVRGGALDGVDVPADRAPSMIDEYPILAVAAAFARGRTRLAGLGELRVKESDRLAAIADGLSLSGVPVERGEDWLEIEGCAGAPAGPEAGTRIATHMDHRLAMAFLVMGIGARQPVCIDDGGMIETSFPGFVDLMNGLGARIAGDAGADIAPIGAAGGAAGRLGHG